MNSEIACPKCSNLKFWKTRDNRLKCQNCRHLFTPKPNQFNISNELLEVVVSEFILEHSTNLILQRIEISKYKLLKILNFLRKLMSEEIPEAFKGEIRSNNEPYIESLKTIREPVVIGILLKEGQILARILNIEPKEVKDFLKNKKRGILPLSETWLKSFGLVFKNSFYRLTPKEKKPKIDVLESFWGYLKKKLLTRGGIRKEKLPLYLGEYVWRYNHRKLSFQEQKKFLLNLIITKQDSNKKIVYQNGEQTS